MRLPILILHICGGTLGMLSGFTSMFLRKGSRRHMIAGQVFVAAMLVMSSCGVWLAAMKSQPGNILGGTLTFYLVTTGWMIARRGDETPGVIDWTGLLVIIGIAATELTWGFEATTSPTGMKYDYPPGPFFFMGTVAVLALVGDSRLVLRGSISATQRLARHLWRMCFAQFIAAASIFLARPHLFPAFMRKTGTLYALSFLPLAVLIFWLIKLRRTNAQKRKGLVRAVPQPSLSAS